MQKRFGEHVCFFLNSLLKELSYIIVQKQRFFGGETVMKQIVYGYSESSKQRKS